MLGCGANRVGFKMGTPHDGRAVSFAQRRPTLLEKVLLVTTLTT